VNDIFRETLDIVAPMLQREGIDVAVTIPRDTRKVLADKLQMEQVLINLIANSTEAMTTNVDRERRLSLSAFNSPGGQGVDIIVADTGPGFPADIDIRHPALFTSAKVDGLGVGLSFSRSIVENHGGELQIGGGAGGAVVTLRLRSKMPGENT
jgi:two-component system, LuxR family, sensor kinase FixL